MGEARESERGGGAKPEAPPTGAEGPGTGSGSQSSRDAQNVKLRSFSGTHLKHSDEAFAPSTRSS